MVVKEFECFHTRVCVCVSILLCITDVLNQLGSSLNSCLCSFSAAQEKPAGDEWMHAHGIK